MSNDWVKKNVKVYSKEMDLKTAQKIPGLRAVFGESYPDPVRVVTLEYDVADIAADVENPKWRNTSVEFCGGTYVVGFVRLVQSYLILMYAFQSCCAYRRHQAIRHP